MKRILGVPATDWAEKVSLYVFNDRKDFVEFVRTVEGREVDANLAASGNLGVAAAIRRGRDPQGGKKDEPPRHHGVGREPGRPMTKR